MSRPDRDGITALVLTLVAFFTRAAFIHLDGMSEPDSVAMAAGMARAVTTDLPLSEAVAYGRHVSPGLYPVVAKIYPLLFNDPRHMIGFLNWLTVICASAMVWPLYYLFRVHLSHHAAIASIVVTLASPIVWECGTYFHPLIPALLLLLFALMTFRRIDASARGVIAFASTIVLSASAFVVRTEILFMLAPLLMASVLSKRPIRNMVMLAICTVIAFAAYMLSLRSVALATDGRGAGLHAYASMLYQMYVQGFSLAGLARSGAWAVMGVGTGLIVVSIAGLCSIILFRARSDHPNWRMLLVAAAWIIPGVLFWLPQPIPVVRHYLMVTIGVSWLVGLTIFQRCVARRAYTVAAAVVVFGLLAPEIAYRSYNATHPEDPKTPHGAFVYFNSHSNQTSERLRQVGASIIRPGENDPSTTLAVVNWGAYVYVIYELATSPDGSQCLSRDSPTIGVLEFQYRIGESSVRLITVPSVLDDVARREIQGITGESVRSGERVFVPEVDSRLGSDIDPSSPLLHLY